LVSIANTNTNTIPTFGELESVVSTNTMPTSSGIIEPEGRSIIFQVSIPNIPDNEKRSVNKRVSGGFVGNDNPGTCTFANVFNLADDQLFEGGVPIYYSPGEDYKELSGQEIPSEGAIKSTFMVSGQRLVFKNPSCPMARQASVRTLMVGSISLLQMDPRVAWWSIWLYMMV
jgi:hypothetical protein